MKHTRKMIMIPEMEYLTLLNMLKGQNQLNYEKAQTDTDISKVLKDPKLSEDIKSKKYDWLIKQKAKIRKGIEKESEKPQKIVMDKGQLQTILTDISKYLGVETTKPIKEKVPAVPRIKTRKEQTPKRQESEYETSYEEPETSLQNIETNYIIHPDYYNDLLKIIKQNKQNLRITKNGAIKDDKGNVIEGSNYKDVVEYLTGKMDEEPEGTQELIDRMKDKTYYKTVMSWTDWHRQHGGGKKRNLLELYKRTRGLIRSKPKKLAPFKPIIWAKIQ